MHMYLHCPLHCAPRVRLLQAVDAWRVAQTSDAFTGEPALVPSRLEALRWVHASTPIRRWWRGGWWVPVRCSWGGGWASRRSYVVHREAVKARRVQRKARLRLCQGTAARRCGWTGTHPPGPARSSPPLYPGGPPPLQRAQSGRGAAAPLILQKKR
jgi:hypothetical protein